MFMRLRDMTKLFCHKLPNLILNKDLSFRELANKSYSLMYSSLSFRKEKGKDS